MPQRDTRGRAEAAKRLVVGPDDLPGVPDPAHRLSISLEAPDQAPRHDPEEIRDALTLPADVPLVLCDARNRESAKQVLITLVEYVMAVHLYGRSAVGSGRNVG